MFSNLQNYCCDIFKVQTSPVEKIEEEKLLKIICWYDEVCRQYLGLHQY